MKYSGKVLSEVRVIDNKYYRVCFATKTEPEEWYYVGYIENNRYYAVAPYTSMQGRG